MTRNRFLCNDPGGLAKFTAFLFWFSFLSLAYPFPLETLGPQERVLLADDPADVLELLRIGELGNELIHSWLTQTDWPRIQEDAENAALLYEQKMLEDPSNSNAHRKARIIVAQLTKTKPFLKLNEQSKISRVLTLEKELEGFFERPKHWQEHDIRVSIRAEMLDLDQVQKAAEALQDQLKKLRNAQAKEEFHRHASDLEKVSSDFLDLTKAGVRGFNGNIRLSFRLSDQNQQLLLESWRRYKEDYGIAFVLSSLMLKWKMHGDLFDLTFVDSAPLGVKRFLRELEVNKYALRELNSKDKIGLQILDQGIPATRRFLNRSITTSLLFARARGFQKDHEFSKGDKEEAIDHAVWALLLLLQVDHGSPIFIEREWQLLTQSIENIETLLKESSDIDPEYRSSLREELKEFQARLDHLHDFEALASLLEERKEELTARLKDIEDEIERLRSDGQTVSEFLQREVNLLETRRFWIIQRKERLSSKRKLRKKAVSILVDFLTSLGPSDHSHLESVVRTVFSTTVNQVDGDLLEDVFSRLRSSLASQKKWGSISSTTLEDLLNQLKFDDRIQHLHPRAEKIKASLARILELSIRKSIEREEQMRSQSQEK